MPAKVDLLYEIPSFFIALALLGVMIVAIYAGIAVGRRHQRLATEANRRQADAVQASLLGLLALLLGFTFSLSLGRYEQRSVEVVSEANAIGTTWLRTDLLGEQRRDAARALLREYGTLRAQTSALTIADAGRHEELVARAEAVLGELWQLAAAEARAANTPVAMGFVTSLNEMIDALGRRDAAVRRHVPELVMAVLLMTFILLGGVVGYSSAIADVRPGVPVYAVVVLIVVLVFMIFDLDRPRRGLIEVDQSPLLAAVAAMGP